MVVPFKNCFSITKTKFSQTRLFLKPTVCKCEHSKELCNVILSGEIGNYYLWFTDGWDKEHIIFDIMTATENLDYKLHYFNSFLPILTGQVSLNSTATISNWSVKCWNCLVNRSNCARSVFEYYGVQHNHIFHFVHMTTRYTANIGKYKNYTSPSPPKSPKNSAVKMNAS